MPQRGEEKREDLRPEPTSQVSVEATRTLHTHIGDRLRRMFDQVVEEPIPDKLRVLLDSLEKPPEPDKS